jgi:hypothetical protein
LKPSTDYSSAGGEEMEHQQSPPVLEIMDDDDEYKSEDDKEATASAPGSGTFTAAQIPETSEEKILRCKFK